MRLLRLAVGGALSEGRPVLFMYHSFQATRERVFNVHPREFAKQMEALAFAGRPVEGLAATLRSRPEGRPGCGITIDDGYECILGVIPTLERFGLRATLYVCPELLGTTSAHGLRRLDEGQLRQVAASPAIEIGSHTSTHPRLTTLGPEAVRREVAGSKAILEDVLSREVTHFAYPYGLWSESVRAEVVEAGYTSAVTVHPGSLRDGDDAHALPRVWVHREMRLSEFRAALTRGGDLLLRTRYGRARPRRSRAVPVGVPG